MAYHFVFLAIFGCIVEFISAAELNFTLKVNMPKFIVVKLWEPVLIECSTKKSIDLDFYWYINQGSPTVTKKGVKFSNFHHTFEEPGRFRVVCKAISKHNITRSKEIMVSVKDECGTPERNSVSDHSYRCLFKFPETDEWKRKCRVFPPESFRLKDAVDEHGFRIVFVEWKTKHPDPFEKHRFGFKLTRHFETDYLYRHIESEVCLITKYLEEIKTALPSSSPYKGRNTYRSTLGELGLKTLKTTYNVSIKSLPHSESITAVIKPRERKVLCQEYVDQHHTVPKYCFVFGNVTMKFVSRDNVNNRTKLLITWKNKDVSSWNDEGLNKTHISVIIFGSKTRVFRQNITSHIWDLPLEDHFTIVFERFLGMDGVETVHSEEFEINTKFLPPKTSPVTVPKESKAVSMLYVGIILSAILLSSCLVIVVVQYLYRKVKTDIRTFMRFTSVSSEDSEIGSMLEEVVEKSSSPKVALVYPHGCQEVERMALFIISQLRTFGVEILCDLLEEERVAKEGLPKVLMDNFNKADYVVVLCTENENDASTLSAHQPYMFVLRLISNSCVFTNETKNCNRYLAVYFDKQRVHVPAYLMPRAYHLPSQFSAFVQNIFGVQTFFSYLYNKIFEQNVPQVAERKYQLQQLTDCLEAKCHDYCFPTTCRKGQINEAETPFFMSTLKLTSDDENENENEDESESESEIEKEAKEPNKYEHKLKEESKELLPNT